ncbi:MAG: hypothetical protein NTX50_24855 [Candidatus Sumerlaeota bacterium]|nr:hypothetical protein [Candidatus Sumerlaeota bacterium]
MNSADERLKICQSLGFASQTELFQFISVEAKKDPDALLQRGLNAKNLAAAGYPPAGLGRMGYDNEALKKLGCALRPNGTPEPLDDSDDQNGGGAARVSKAGNIVPMSARPGVPKKA